MPKFIISPDQREKPGTLWAALDGSEGKWWTGEGWGYELAEARPVAFEERTDAIDGISVQWRRVIPGPRVDRQNWPTGGY